MDTICWFILRCYEVMSIFVPVIFVGFQINAKIFENTSYRLFNYYTEYFIYKDSNIVELCIV